MFLSYECFFIHHQKPEILRCVLLEICRIKDISLVIFLHIFLLHIVNGCLTLSFKKSLKYEIVLSMNNLLNKRYT